MERKKDKVEVGKNNKDRGKKGERTWIGKIRRIGEKWWRWNEEKEVLKDERGIIKKIEAGEEVGQKGKLVK